MRSIECVVFACVCLVSVLVTPVRGLAQVQVVGRATGCPEYRMGPASCGELFVVQTDGTTIRVVITREVANRVWLYDGAEVEVIGSLYPAINGAMPSMLAKSVQVRSNSLVTVTSITGRAIASNGFPYKSGGVVRVRTEDDRIWNVHLHQGSIIVNNRSKPTCDEDVCRMHLSLSGYCTSPGTLHTHILREYNYDVPSPR